MKKRKIAIIQSAKSSSWKSCSFITPNILRAYECLKNTKNEVLPMSVYIGYDELDSICQKLIAGNYSDVVFIDHYPHPWTLLKHYQDYYLRRNIPHPRFHLHLFGCVVFWMQHWKSIEPLLMKTHSLFYAASEAQKSFLARVFQDSENIQVLPFPVNPADFYVDPKLRMSTRKKLGIAEHEKLLIYSGRYTLQKNTDYLFGLFKKMTMEDKNLKFIFAGEFDDQGLPFWGINNLLGQSYNHFIKNHHNNPVLHLGDLNKPELNAILNAADLTVSLSIYNDEDFGYAPLESLFAGTRSLTTSWGGYKSFQHPEFCPQVEVVSDGHQFHLHEEPILTSMKRLINEPWSEKSRKICSEHYQKMFSIQSVAAQLKKNLTKVSEFKGFSSDLDEFAKTYTSFPAFKFDDMNARRKYFEHYEAYYKITVS